MSLNKRSDTATKNTRTSYSKKARSKYKKSGQRPSKIVPEDPTLEDPKRCPKYIQDNQPVDLIYYEKNASETFQEEKSGMDYLGDQFFIQHQPSKKK